MGDAVPTPTLCMACTDSTCDLKPEGFERRALGPRDVLIDMKFCGGVLSAKQQQHLLRRADIMMLTPCVRFPVRM